MGRLVARSVDDIVAIAGRPRIRLAQDREDWPRNERHMLSSGLDRTVDEDDEWHLYILFQLLVFLLCLSPTFWGLLQCNRKQQNYGTYIILKKVRWAVASCEATAHLTFFS